VSITYPLPLPISRGEATVTFGYRDSAAVTASPFTGDEEVQEWARQGWLAQVSFPPLAEADARVVIAWLVSLRGRRGTFLMGDPLRASPRGVGTGTPLVKGAGQTGESLLVDGLTPSTAGILKAGDYFQLGSGATAYLHMNLTDASTDSGGNATLDVWPRLRVSPADNAAITLINPMGRWRLRSNEQSWDEQLAQLYGISFECAEALP
jgi:hypothetical protein